MTTEEEFEAFVKQNRDLIESLIELQKDSAHEFVGAEKRIAKDTAEHVIGYADYGRTKAEEAARALYQTVTDPEVQRHFMNMGMEFFMGMSAIMSKAPMPDFMRDGISATESSLRSAACRSNEDCGARKSGPKKVNIDVSEDPKRDSDDVFKDSEDRDGDRKGRGVPGQVVGRVRGPGRGRRRPVGPCVRRAQRRLRDDIGVPVARPPRVHRVPHAGAAAGGGDRAVGQVRLPRPQVPGPPGGGAPARVPGGHRALGAPLPALLLARGAGIAGAHRQGRADHRANGQERAPAPAGPGRMGMGRARIPRQPQHQGRPPAGRMEGPEGEGPVVHGRDILRGVARRPSGGPRWTR